MSLVGPGNWDPSNHWNTKLAEEYINSEDKKLVNKYLRVFHKNKSIDELNGREKISLAASLNSIRRFEALRKRINK